MGVNIRAVESNGIHSLLVNNRLVIRTHNKRIVEFYFRLFSSARYKGDYTIPLSKD